MSTTYKIPYVSSIEEKVNDAFSFGYQVLGGRVVQEDAYFIFATEKYHAYFVLDGFGGQSIIIYAKNNLERILRDCRFNPKEAIDELDLEVRINALYHPDYQQRIQ